MPMRTGNSSRRCAVSVGVESGLRRGERGHYAITGVAEQKPVIRLDCGAQHFVMRQQRSASRRRRSPTDGSNPQYR